MAFSIRIVKIHGKELIFSLDPQQMPLVVPALNRSRFPLCKRRSCVGSGEKP